MQMEINAEEQRFLHEALDHYLLELTAEIAGTDKAEFREELKHEKEVLMILKKRFES